MRLMDLIKSIILFLLLFSLAACNPRMQLITLDSTDLHIKDREIQCSDTLVFMDYNFYSLNGLMQLTIVNISSVPVFIDWDKSYCVANGDVRRNYYYTSGSHDVNMNKGFDPKVGFSLHIVNQSNIANNNLPGNTASISDDSITVLLPKQYIKVSPFRLEDSRIILLDYKKTKTEEKQNWADTMKSTHVEVYSFDINKTPRVYTNHLVISTKPDFRNLLLYEDNFWIKEIRRMDPRQVIGVEDYYHYLDNTQVPLPVHPYRSANRFYIR